MHIYPHYSEKTRNSYKRGARIAFGRCLKYFAVHDMLPIREANPAKSGSRIYVKA